MLTAIFDFALDAIIAVDQRCNVIFYNRGAEKIFGRSRGDALGQSLEKLIPAWCSVDRIQPTGIESSVEAVSDCMSGAGVVYGRRANGEIFPLEASISQFVVCSSKLVAVILRDVTERIQAQEERSAVAAAAHAVGEREKARLACELHNELAQLLSALKMNTAWLRDKASITPAALNTKLTEMLSVLDLALATTRRIAADLRPPLLDNLGLAPALQWLVDNFRQRSGVAAKLLLDEDLKLPEPYATAVFRIVQELLANVAKHAAASQVEIVVARARQVVTLEISDNGCGFDLAALQRAQSLGLMALRERAQLLKGNCIFKTAPGQGTRVEVQIPLQRAVQA